VLCFAPTRSGKGVGLVVPTLLTWPGSCIVHDIKGENWTLTSGFRAQHGRVSLFDPTNTKSAAYNPLLEVRRGEWEVRDVQNVADVLVDPEGSRERRNHWEKTSHALLLAGTNALGVDFGKIDRLQWQGRDLGWLADDLIVECTASTGKRSAGISIKSDRQVTSSGFPPDFVGTAWAQWFGVKSERVLRGSDDAVVLMVGSLADENAFP
jgi:type IV secretory system conjugative DNA transfer VirD4/TraG family protein